MEERVAAIDEELELIHASASGSGLYSAAQRQRLAEVCWLWSQWRGAARSREELVHAAACLSRLRLLPFSVPSRRPFVPEHRRSRNYHPPAGTGSSLLSAAAAS